MSSQRVLVTGTGAVCGAGMNPGAILDAVREGRSAIGPITQWDTTGWPCRVAAEIPDFNPRALVDDRKLHKLIRRTDLVGQPTQPDEADRPCADAHRQHAHDARTHLDRRGEIDGRGLQGGEGRSAEAGHQQRRTGRDRIGCECESDQ